MFTMPTLPLFAVPHNGTPTSRAAAKSVEGQVEYDRRMILQALQRAKSYGATDDELQELLSMSGNTERPRRGELVKQGLVAHSGFVRTTHSGRSAAVWIAVA